MEKTVKVSMCAVLDITFPVTIANDRFCFDDGTEVSRLPNLVNVEGVVYSLVNKEMVDGQRWVIYRRLPVQPRTLVDTEPNPKD